MKTWFSDNCDDAVARRPLTRFLALACGCLLLGSSQLQAQTVYRIVGPDGRVTFSDKPPVTPATKVTAVDNTVAANQSGAAALPFELREVVGKYPVTLYTSKSCAPCDSGRSLLIARGVPFTEKTISTAQDAETFQEMSGSASLPFFTLGAQHVAGFSSSEWTQYLNAAGYPERSKLPTSYRRPGATSLTTVEKPSAIELPAPPTQPAAVAPAPPSTTPNNPPGIQF